MADSKLKNIIFWTKIAVPPLPIFFVHVRNMYFKSVAHFLLTPSMRSLIPFSLLLTILDLSVNVNAAISPLHARSESGLSQADLRPRASGSASTIQNITNLNNVQYVTNITIAGVELTVSLDTGRFVKLIFMNRPSFSELPSK
jgi:hypothetical protein